MCGTAETDEIADLAALLRADETTPPLPDLPLLALSTREETVHADVTSNLERLTFVLFPRRGFRRSGCRWCSEPRLGT
jgi:hypothetical protein